MTRAELLTLLVGQARQHDFQFRKWFTAHSGIPWSGADDAVQWLSRGKRATMLLFSHDFARAFFQGDDRVMFVVPPQSFERVVPGGGKRTVERKAHIRRSSREDTWQFHLREMAAAAEPLRYIKRYLITEETLAEVKLPAVSSLPEEDGDYDSENLVRDAS